MVTLDISRGSDLVEALEHAKLNLRLALWAYLSEFEDWRLILSSPQFDTAGSKGRYGLLQEALDASGVPLEKTPPVLILPTTDKFVRDLRRRVGKTKSQDGVRLSLQLFGDRFVEDGYVYRVN